MLYALAVVLFGIVLSLKRQSIDYLVMMLVVPTANEQREWMNFLACPPQSLLQAKINLFLKKHKLVLVYVLFQPFQPSILNLIFTLVSELLSRKENA